MGVLKRTCQECGAEIKIVYVTPDSEVVIWKDNVEAKDILVIKSDPYLKFECSNDHEHAIGIDEPSFRSWVVKLEESMVELGFVFAV